MWYEGTVLSLNRDEQSFLVHFDADGEESSFFYAGESAVKWRYLKSNFLKNMRKDEEKEYVPDNVEDDEEFEVVPRRKKKSVKRRKKEPVITSTYENDTRQSNDGGPSDLEVFRVGDKWGACLHKDLNGKGKNRDLGKYKTRQEAVDAWMMFLDANARARAIRAGQKERILADAVRDVSSRPMPSGRGA